MIHNAFLRIYKSGYNKGNYTPMLISALFLIAKLWKELKCPTTDE
jgi:hypothetical protein